MDTISWRFFTISTFFDIVLSKGDLKEGEMPHGSIPLVSCGGSNNGIVDYIDENGDGKAQIFPSECITVDMFCQAYYQPNPFFAVSHGRVNVLIPKKNFEKNILLFFCAMINNEKYRFCYGRAVYSNVIKKLEVKLPITEHNSVDWDYIKSFMGKIKVNFPMTKNTAIQVKNVELWKYFSIKKLFTKLQIGKAQDSILQDGDDCLYLGAKKTANGVMRTCQYDSELAHDGNCIVFICNGQGSVGYTNYMDRPFIATTDLVMGYNEHLNPYVGMFLVTVLDLERPKYSFGRKWKTHLADTEIKLPATADGKPDWEYMENYIKSLPYGDCI